MSIEVICALITAVAGVIPTIVSVVLLVRNIIKNKNWELVKTITREAMTTIEEYAVVHPGMSSDEKLAMALEAVKAGLAAASIDFDEDLIKQIVAYIKEMCKWTKSIN